MFLEKHAFPNQVSTIVFTKSYGQCKNRNYLS